MSHFSGLVIGNDIDELLLPYSEQDERCFTEHIDYEVKEEYEKGEYTDYFIKEYPNEEDRTLFNYCKWRFGDDPIITFAEHQKWQINKMNHTYFIRDVQTDSLVFAGRYRYYNDFAKYDYYSEDGGRFYDTLDEIVFKDGDNKNRIMSNIDLDAMITKITHKREDDYYNIRKSFIASAEKLNIKIVVNEDGSFLPKFTYWQEFYKRVRDKEITIEEAREQYGSQDTIKIWEAMLIDYPFSFLSAESYDFSLDDFIDRFTLPFFVIVDNLGWHEEAEMGWWGLTTNDKDVNVWQKEQIEILRRNIKENPNTQFTLCDFHI